MANYFMHNHEFADAASGAKRALIRMFLFAAVLMMATGRLAAVELGAGREAVIATSQRGQAARC